MTTTISERKYGVEIEFTGIDQETAVNAIRTAGIQIAYEGYNHTSRSNWKLVYDSTCGLEAVSPILQGEQGLREVATVCYALSGAGAQVNRKCGYHVHLDVADFEMLHFKNLIKLWIKFEDVLDTFQPQSRRGRDNSYCQSNLGYFGQLHDGWTQAQGCQQAFGKINQCHSVEQLCRLFGTRYMKLNCEAYFRHRTIEVRHHAGTLNPEKAVNWILLMMELYDMAKSAKAVRTRPANENTGMARHKWFFQCTTQKQLRTFYTKRARQLAAA